MLVKKGLSTCMRKNSGIWATWVPQIWEFHFSMLLGFVPNRQSQPGEQQVHHQEKGQVEVCVSGIFPLEYLNCHGAQRIHWSFLPLPKVQKPLLAPSHKKCLCTVYKWQWKFYNSNWCMKNRDTFSPQHEEELHPQHGELVAPSHGDSNDTFEGFCWTPNLLGLCSSIWNKDWSEGEEEESSSKERNPYCSHTKSTELFIKVSANHSSMKTDSCNWSWVAKTEKVISQQHSAFFFKTLESIPIFPATPQKPAEKKRDHHTNGGRLRSRLGRRILLKSWRRGRLAVVVLIQQYLLLRRSSSSCRSWELETATEWIILRWSWFLGNGNKSERLSPTSRRAAVLVLLPVLAIVQWHHALSSLSSSLPRTPCTRTHTHTQDLSLSLSLSFSS